MTDSEKVVVMRTLCNDCLEPIGYLMSIVPVLPSNLRLHFAAVINNLRNIDRVANGRDIVTLETIRAEIDAELSQVKA